jgi:uncharacterized secreted protein with C-terminal beta-propeller domain
MVFFGHSCCVVKVSSDIQRNVSTNQKMTIIWTISNIKTWKPTARWFITTGVEYVIKNAEQTQERIKFNGTHQILACIDNVYLVNENPNTMCNTKTEALLVTSKDVGLVVKVQKIKCMIMYDQQRAVACCVGA